MKKVSLGASKQSEIVCMSGCPAHTEGQCGIMYRMQ
jgi:hypothetical protein